MQQTLHLEITVGASSSEYSLWKTGKEVKGKNGDLITARVNLEHLRVYLLKAPTLVS